MPLDYRDVQLVLQGSLAFQQVILVVFELRCSRDYQRYTDCAQSNVGFEKYVIHVHIWSIRALDYRDVQLVLQGSLAFQQVILVFLNYVLVKMI
jgi:hypothetical protein